MRNLIAYGSVLALALGIMTVAAAPSALAQDVNNSFTANALSTWQADGVVWSIASAQGKVFAGGGFNQLRPPGTAAGDASSVSRSNLAVLDAATGAPTSCVLDVTRASSSAVVRAVTASPDGNTIYVGGLFSTINGAARNNLAAIDVASCQVLAFDPDPNSFVYAINVTPTTVYFGGNFSSVGGHARSDLAAASAGSGNLLPWAPTSDDDIFALATDPSNGNVIIGGRINLLNGQDSHALGIVDGTTGTTNVKNYPAGFFPWSSGTGQRNGTSVVKTIGVDGTGFYVGNEGTGSGIFDGRTAFDWGSYNQRWRDNCLGATQSVVPYNNTLLWASHSHDCSSENWWEDGSRHFFGSESTSSKQIRSWFPQANDGISEGIGPRALSIAHSDNTDYLWAAGEFTQINGANQQGLTRFGKTPDLTTPANMFPPLAFDTVPGQITVAWRTTTDSDDGTLTYLVYRNNSSTPIATVRADSTFWNRPQASWTDKSVTPGTAYSYRVVATDGTNSSPSSVPVTATATGMAPTGYPGQVLADGASSYFRADDSSGPLAIFAASQGNGNLAGIYTGTVNRTVANGPIIGDPGSYMTFDGSSSFLHTEARQDSPAVFSIETWFKTTTTRGGKLIGFGNRAVTNGINALSGNYDKHIYMTNSGALVFGVNSGGVQTLSSAGGLNDGQWHQVTGTQGPTGMALYIDGARVGTNSVTTNQTFNGYWRIGGDNLGGWPSQPASNFFAGSMDETAIYPTALTTGQVANHFGLSGRTNSLTPGSPKDSYGSAVYSDNPDSYWRLDQATSSTEPDASGNTHQATYNTDVTRSVSGALNNNADTAVAVKGASSSTVYETTAVASPTVFSAEAWFNTTSTSGGKILGFGSSATGNSSSYDKHIYMGNDGRVTFGVYTGSTSVVTSPNAYNNGAWHHVVGVQDPTGLKLYVDGSLAGSNGTTTNQSYTGFWRVGGDTLNGWPNQPTNNYFSGKIDEVAVYSTALTATQVSTHYALGSSTPPADTTAPSAPAGLAASVMGSNVALSWTASTDNVGVTGYQVYRSATAGFTAATGNKIADIASGTTYSDTARPVGTWYYLVKGIDAAGNLSGASNQATATVADTTAPTAPSGLTAAATGTRVDLSWTAATDNVGVTGYTVYRSATTGFTPSSTSKLADVTGTTYSDTTAPNGKSYYLVTAGDAAGNVSDPSTEANATVTLQDTTAPSAPSTLTTSVNASTVTVRWTAATDNVGVTGYQVYRSATAGFSPGVTMKIADVVGTATTYNDTARPAGTWYYLVTATDAAANRGPASNEATAVVSDSTVPTAPTTLTASATGSSVQLSWTAATDDVGVTAYTVYRSTSSGFTPGATNKIADVTPGTSYLDTTGPTGTSYYLVTAKDAAGNIGPASNQASATVSGPTQTTTSLFPTEDTYGNQGAPATAYGTTASVASRGNLGYTAYLRFALPTAPTGKTLVGAKLMIQTTSDSFAGSADTHTVSFSTSTWSESTLNWNNRPAVGTSIGSITGATALNTKYSTILSASALVSAPAGPITLAVSSTGTDNLWFWSSNYSIAASRPQLVLTYE